MYNMGSPFGGYPPGVIFVPMPTGQPAENPGNISYKTYKKIKRLLDEDSKENKKDDKKKDEKKKWYHKQFSYLEVLSLVLFFSLPCAALIRWSARFIFN